MSITSRRRRTFLALATVAVAATAASTAPAAAEPARTGIEVVHGRHAVPNPLPEEVALALDDALTYATQHPDELGYPWVDRATNTLVLPAVTDGGAVRAVTFAPSRGRSVALRVRRVTFSYRTLHGLHNAVIDSRHDLPDGDLISGTGVVEERNQVEVTVRAVTDRLLRGLAARYDARALFVRVHSIPQPRAQSRDHDFSPYYGGAHISQNTPCTSAFGWYTAKYVMITAGHCAPEGGNFWAGVNPTGSDYIGSVWSGYRESWNDTIGTVIMTGQSFHRGDIAYINMESATGKVSAGRIYRGGPTSTTSAPVKGWLGRRLTPGDPFCTGGAKSGEICGWSVYDVLRTVEYSTGLVARPMVIGVPNNTPCTQGGDSGGPVYQVRTDGGITAMGVHSAGMYADSDCWAYFTDLYDVQAAFPGDMLRG